MTLKFNSKRVIWWVLLRVKTIVNLLTGMGVILFFKSDFFDLLMYFTTQWSRWLSCGRNTAMKVYYIANTKKKKIMLIMMTMVIKADTKFHKSRLNVEIKHSIQTLRWNNNTSCSRECAWLGVSIYHPLLWHDFKIVCLICTHFFMKTLGENGIDWNKYQCLRHTKKIKRNNIFFKVEEPIIMSYKILRMKLKSEFDVSLVYFQNTQLYYYSVNCT